VISERRHVACQSLVLSLALSLLGVAHAADKKPTNDKLPDWAPTSIPTSASIRTWPRRAR
jgi:hypothetical protein